MLSFTVQDRTITKVLSVHGGIIHLKPVMKATKISRSDYEMERSSQVVEPTIFHEIISASLTFFSLSHLKSVWLILFPFHASLVISSVKESYCSCVHFQAMYLHLSVYVRIVTNCFLSTLILKDFFPTQYIFHLPS